jgi:pyridoxine 5-phosphate synthase
VTNFSINLNKFALIRNSRGNNRPDLLAIARRCLAAGVHGITVHPRPDQRHIRDDDVRDLAQLLRDWPDVELNVEGNPTARYLELVLEVKAHQATLVPDAENQLTSDHGWDLLQKGDHAGVQVGDHVVDHVRQVVERLRAANIRTSLFLDPVIAQVEAAARTGADRIELYTEAYARGAAAGQGPSAVKPYTGAAAAARALGLGVNAGHDLDLANLPPFLQAVPGVLEVSIGHAVVCESFDYTLEGAIDRYLGIVGRTD